jgi:hypothetical protein
MTNSFGTYLCESIVHFAGVGQVYPYQSPRQPVRRPLKVQVSNVVASLSQFLDNVTSCFAAAASDNYLHSQTPFVLCRSIIARRRPVKPMNQLSGIAGK